MTCVHLASLNIAFVNRGGHGRGGRSRHVMHGTTGDEALDRRSRSIVMTVNEGLVLMTSWAYTQEMKHAYSRACISSTSSVSTSGSGTSRPITARPATSSHTSLLPPSFLLPPSCPPVHKHANRQASEREDVYTFGCMNIDTYI